MKFITDSKALLIGMWLGAACFFSFAVAPSAFGVLADRELAGNVVSRTLMIVNFSGIGIGIVLLIASLIKSTGRKAVWVWIERFLLLIVTAACAAGQFVIAPWLSVIRSQAGKPMQDIPIEDALRVQFDALHQYSVWALMTAMIAALLTYILIAGLSSNRSAKNTAKELDFHNEFIN